VQKLASSLRAIDQAPVNTLTIDEQTDSGLEDSAVLFEGNNSAGFYTSLMLSVSLEKMISFLKAMR
jgi:hypothetical protein